MNIQNTWSLVPSGDCVCVSDWLLTSLSDSTWMSRMALLGTALFLWLSAARTRGRWPRGGTWSASWLCELNRQTAAVQTVSRASPCRTSQGVEFKRTGPKKNSMPVWISLQGRSHWGCFSPAAPSGSLEERPRTLAAFEAPILAEQ